MPSAKAATPIDRSCFSVFFQFVLVFVLVFPVFFQFVFEFFRSFSSFFQVFFPVFVAFQVFLFGYHRRPPHIPFQAAMDSRSNCCAGKRPKQSFFKPAWKASNLHKDMMAWGFGLFEEVVFCVCFV